MEKVQIIPPPKDVDPKVLAWKGAAVLGKMDGVSDLWITSDDWVSNSLGCLVLRDSFPPKGYLWNACPEGKMFLPLTLAPFPATHLR